MKIKRINRILIFVLALILGAFICSGNPNEVENILEEKDFIVTYECGHLALSTLVDYCDNQTSKFQELYNQSIIKISEMEKKKAPKEKLVEMKFYKMHFLISTRNARDEASRYRMKLEGWEEMEQEKLNKEMEKKKGTDL